MTKEQVLGVIRHLLTIGGGVLVAKGGIDTIGLENAVGAIVTLIGLVWSVLAKKPPVAK